MLRDGLVKSAQAEKNRLNVEDHKFKYFQLHKWNILKSIRKDMEIQAEKTKEQRRRTTTWVQKCLTYHVIKQTYQ